jgi:hypothetical protein
MDEIRQNVAKPGCSRRVAHFNATHITSLISATVPLIPPIDNTVTPGTLLALFKYMAANCSC